MPIEIGEVAEQVALSGLKSRESIAVDPDDVGKQSKPKTGVTAVVSTVVPTDVIVNERRSLPVPEVAGATEPRT